MFLSSLVSQENVFPLEIRGNKFPVTTLETYRRKMEDLLRSSKKNNTYGYTIDCIKTKTRYIGSQSLPKRIYFDSEQDFVGYLGKINEVRIFKDIINKTIGLLPQLKEWLSIYPLKVIANLQHWQDILRVVGYFHTNPKPSLYIRELPMKVHTKFIE